MPERRIVCAAVKRGSLILCGARHWDMTMHKQFERLRESSKHPMTGWVQGFIDQRGVFVNRREAWFIAEAADQIRHPDAAIRGLNGLELCSEVLY